MTPHDPQATEPLATADLEPGVAVGERASSEAPRLLEPGDVVGRYRIRECIGEGGVGVVYAAEDPGLARVVAIKVLRPAEGRQAEAQQRRMLREAQALARVSHRNLVMVFDVGMHEGRIWIAMEYVVGDTLDQWLERERRTWREIVEAFISAGNGLAAVHAAGLVHRDFKPGNVLVRADGTVQVLDFGLAARVGEQIEISEHDERAPLALPSHDALVATMTRSVLGTPAYMAPEQFLLQPTDGRTDQFGFCVALYEALYGRRPFHGEDIPDLMHAIVDGLPGLPPELPGLPEVVRRAIARGLSVNKDARFADMNALLEELASTRVAAQPKSGGWMRFALGVLVGGGVLAGVGLWFLHRDDPPPPPAVVTPAPEVVSPDPAPPPPTGEPKPLRELPSLADPDEPVIDEPARAQEPSEPESAPRVRERDGGTLPRMPTPSSG
ncbi:MAG TPA: serine/threonine-protein kinase, partial [Nannocystaceae bacterium]|nr:serine/threonine-protein kinase [Nannocystaceae bacterium]